MTKTFTCREFGGVCEARFAGETVMDLMQKAGPHMMSDDAHNAVMSLQERTGESKEQWMARIQREFDEKPHDA